jgi:hypothetical protein
MHRILAFFFLAGTTLPQTIACAGEPAVGTVDKLARNAYESVRTADEFIIGGVGVAGTTSGQETAFRHLLKQPEPLARCQQLLAEGTPAGQLYGLLGLRLLDPPTFEAALPRYRNAQTPVQSMSGCIRFRTTAAELSQQISKGNFQ